MKAIHKAVGSYTLCGRVLRDTMIAGDVPTCKYCIAGGVGPHKKVVAILKESTPSEPKIPLNYAQRAVRDETGKVIRFEPFDKARLKEALKEVKAKNKEIRDSYQADNETMSFRAAKESTPLTEKEESQEDKLIKLINMYWTFDDNQRHTHTWHDKQDCIEQIKTHFTITRNLKENQ